MQQQNVMKLQSTIKYNSTSPAWRFFSNSFKRSCGSTKNQPTHPSQLWHLRMVLFSQQPIWILNPETSPNISMDVCPLTIPVFSNHRKGSHGGLLDRTMGEFPTWKTSPPSPQTQLRAVRASHHFVHAELGGLSAANYLHDKLEAIDHAILMLKKENTWWKVGEYI